MSIRETPEMALPVVGECHSEVPKGGLKLHVPAGDVVAFAYVCRRSLSFACDA